MEMNYMLKTMLKITIAIAMIMNFASGYSDPRVSYSIPYNDPDPSLRTTDPFYGGINTLGADYILPPIFGGEIVIGNEERPGLKPIKTSNKTLTSFENVSAYDLTEDEMIRANITAGKESWL